MVLHGPLGPEVTEHRRLGVPQGEEGEFINIAYFTIAGIYMPLGDIVYSLDGAGIALREKRDWRKLGLGVKVCRNSHAYDRRCCKPYTKVCSAT